MRPADIPQVVAIDNLSFDPPWSARSYNYEVTQSTYSHMVVLEQQQQIPLPWWRRLLRLGTDNGVGVPHGIVGYGGLWHVADEAHISTIAVHPDQRGSSYGALLLGAMIRRALTLSAAYIVLEVRVSNTVAQRLYEQFEFETHGVKANYYRSNNEDAYDMRLDLNNAGAVARFETRYDELMRRLRVKDQYSTNERPRAKS
jgi:ribosomal-protein-alanine N-acetyltransferase